MTQRDDQGGPVQSGRFCFMLRGKHAWRRAWGGMLVSGNKHKGWIMEEDDPFHRWRRSSQWGKVMRLKQLLTSTKKSRRLLAQRAARIRWAKARKAKISRSDFQ